MLFSESMEEFKGELPASIMEVINEVREFFSIPEVKVLKYNAHYVAIPVSIKVSLPTMGPVNGIDIRDEEPILIKISLERYPDSMPSVLSDRKDFPKTHLPHLYVSRDKLGPASLCLVRNSPDEWFANKRIKDLLNVVSEWFFKAGTGKLSEDGEEFDPTRLEGFSGSHLYKYEELYNIVSKDERFVNELPFAILLCGIDKRGEKSRNGLVYRTINSVPFAMLEKMRNIILKVYKIPELKEGYPLFGVLVWDENQAEDDQYCTSMPTTYGGLVTYFGLKGIDIKKILRIYIENKLVFRTAIPVIHAVKRPQKMVGYNGEYEFLNFVIMTEGIENDMISEDADVINQQHLEPFTRDMAEMISGEKRDGRTLYIGAGSLGSKIITHNARAGKIVMGIADKDEFLEHNLGRHVLFSDKVGSNKAEALKKELDAVYELDKEKDIDAFPYGTADLDKGILNSHDWIIDSTASFAVQNWLVQQPVKFGVNIARCELADAGRLGLLYIEGSNRNPRIDDLVNYTYYKSASNPVLNEWRKRDMDRTVTNLNIGLGCSSPTTIMTDDTISLHASVFSKVLFNERHRKHIGKNGLLFRSVFESEEIPKIYTESETVRPFELIECHAGSGWELRVRSGVTEELLELCRKKGEVETGGVLLGISNYKTKTIHVFEVVTEPQDSHGDCVGFTRGVKGLPEYVNSIKERTGQVIGYIAEWHTHPMGLEVLSNRDVETIEQLKTMNRKVPIPTCAVIVTKGEVIPYVYE